MSSLKQKVNSGVFKFANVVKWKLNVSYIGNEGTFVTEVTNLTE